MSDMHRGSWRAFECGRTALLALRMSVGINIRCHVSPLGSRDREAQERELRDALKSEWMAAQERIRNEPLEITYSYWDGTGHRCAHCILCFQGVMSQGG